MAEDDRLGIAGIQADPDPVVDIVSNVFRKSSGRTINTDPTQGRRQRQGTRGDQRGSSRRIGGDPRVTRRARTKQQTSPVGAAFGDLAALGVAKLLGSGSKSKRNLALQQSRFETTSGRADKNVDIQERNVESLISRRESETSQGAERLGLAKTAQENVQSRSETAQTESARQFDIGAELKMADIAQSAGVKFTGPLTSFSTPARTGSAKFTDARKARIKFTEDRIDQILNSGFKIEPGSSTEAELFRLQNSLAKEIESSERFGANAQAQSIFEAGAASRATGGASGVSREDNLGVR